MIFLIGLRKVVSSYRTAWGLFWPLFATHLAIRLVIAAGLVPLSSLLLALAISLSDQNALTDQDIARFLLTPAGFSAALAVASLAIVGVVLDLSVMTDILRSGERTARGGLKLLVKMVWLRFVGLFWFSLHLVLRILLIALPFLVAAGGVALFAMSDYDINYYLTYHPPAFLISVSVIAVIALALGLVLLSQLSSWAVALYILLFRNQAPRSVFAESARWLKGQKSQIFALILSWGAIRVVLGALVMTVSGVLIGVMPNIFGSDLRYIALATIAILLFWVFGNAAISALSNGALAAVLNDVYEEISAGNKEEVKKMVPLCDSSPGPSFATVMIAAVSMVAAGVYMGGEFLDRVGSKSTVEIIAHRGASGARPENTMAAVRKAVEEQADWVEIDVQESADGEVIIAHDSDFMRQGGIDLKVWNATKSDLANIDIGSWFDPLYADERTPTLREVLTGVKNRGKVIIELKYYGHDVDLEARVAGIVEEVGMADDVAIMSLKYTGVKKMRALRPSWRYGVLAARAIGDLSGLEADFLALNTGQISLGLIRRAHSQGKLVYVWTVDDPVTMSRMISMGIDGLITNEPALARKVMEARNGLSTAERLMLWLTDQLRIESFDLVADESDA